MASPDRETLEPPQVPDAGRLTRATGDRSRARVLEHAAALATVEGLDGVSIARIAAATGMPKSSVYVLFGSKQELQLATIDAARANFIRHVVTPVTATTPPGRHRLQRLCDSYLDYVEQRIFPGGCFFVTASAEMGGRHGPVRDRVALYQGQWRQLLSETARQAYTAQELAPGTDPDQLAFELGALLAGSGIAAVLHDDNTLIDRARQAVHAQLSSQDGATTG
jgi:AcrR family transcriptional regulator